MLMSRRIPILFAACGVALVVLAGLAWRAGVFAPAPTSGPGGPFVLQDQSGKPVTEAILRGKWSVVFFGFTYCPDVCPTTLAALAQAQTLMGPKAERVQFVFVSLDPERDRPAQLKAYLANDAFPKGTIGLTGSPAQIGVVAKAYRVFYEKNGTGSDYLINHSTASYIMDPKGRFARVLPFGISPEEIANQISGAMTK
jgi:protein SCO1